METAIGYTFEYTNTCTCSSYDEDTDTYIAMDYCDGHCWETTVDDFALITTELFDNNETLWWKVSNLRLWDGNHNGYGFAMCPEDLLSLMTVKSEWTIRGELFNNCIKYSLYHHDAPTGSSSTLTMVSEEQREELGLY